EGEKAASWARFREHFKRLIRAAAQPNSLGNSMLDGATRRHASHHVIGSGARVLAALPESFLDTALRTGRATIPVRSLSPVQQRAIVEYQRVAHGARVAIHHEFAPHRAEKGEPEPPVPAAPGPAEEAFVMVSVGGPQGDGEEAPIGVGVFDPRSGLNHGIGFGPFSLTGDELLQIPRHFDSRRCTLSRPGDLQLPPFGLLWEDALIQFARLNGVSVLSDAFDPDYARHGEWSFPPGTMPEQILDRFCIPYKYTWNASEELVLFRQKQWPFMRERQIPERLARRWRQMARESGEYPLAELAGMAAMHPEQRRMLHRYAGNEAQVAAGVPQFAEVLLLFGALTPAQQGAAEKGLTVDQFDLAQQKLLAPVVARLRPDARGLSQSLRQLSITSSPGKPAAVLTLLFRDGERRTATIDRRATPSPDPWAIRRGATGLRAAP
ncbi:MAG TPA: hypothetical protein VK689_18905, partial [Armatimonadota bacterium]|nr:hypothetical protein [Armatimonadota bacterium]